MLRSSLSYSLNSEASLSIHAWSQKSIPEAAEKNCGCRKHGTLCALCLFALDHLLLLLSPRGLKGVCTKPLHFTSIKLKRIYSNRNRYSLFSASSLSCLELVLPVSRRILITASSSSWCSISMTPALVAIILHPTINGACYVVIQCI